MAQSTFTALNLSEDEVDLEEHTRELQIEEAFKIFQRALQLQKERQYDEADAEYAALFRLEVVSKAAAYVSPTLQSLKYLCFRNRGLYKFAKLADAGHADRHELLSVADDLVTALEYGEGDTVLLDVLHGLYAAFGETRLARFALEYELMKHDHRNGSDDELSFVRGGRYALPHTLRVLGSYGQLLSSIGDLAAAQRPDGFVARNRVELPPAAPAGRYAAQLEKLGAQLEPAATSEPELVDVELTRDADGRLSWNDVLIQLQAVLPKPRGRARCHDNYLLTADPVERVRIRVLDEASEPMELTPADDAERPEERPDDSDAADADTPAETPEREDPDKESAEVRKRSMRSRTEGASEADITGHMRGFVEALDAYLALLPTKPELGAALHGRQVVFDEFARDFPAWGYYECKVFDDDFSNNDDYSVAQMLTTATAASPAGSVDALNGSQAALDETIALTNESHTHVAPLRVQLLTRLFEPFAPGQPPPILAGRLSREALEALRLFVDASDVALHESLSSQLPQMDAAGVARALHVAVAVVELATDTFAATDIELRRLKPSEKAKLADLRALQTAVAERVARWTRLLDELRDLADALRVPYAILECRRIWASIIQLQHEHPVQSARMVARVRAFQAYVQRVDESLEIAYANYEHIPRLNVKSVSLELARIGVTDRFSQITKAGADSDERRTTLEALLLAAEPSPEIREMQRFLERSSEELHMRLWLLLLREYAATDDLAGLTAGLERGVAYLAHVLEASTTTDRSKSRRLVARVVSCLGALLRLFVDALAAGRWAFRPQTTGMLPPLALLLRVLNGFVLCMDLSAAGIRDCLRGNARKTAGRLYDIVAMAYTALCVYTTAQLPAGEDPGPTNDLLSHVHEFLGSRGVCEAADGVFLDFAETTLLALGWEQSDRDVFQLVNCRYHIRVAAGLFTPVDHGTTGCEMSEASALGLNSYAVPLCFQRRNPMFNLPRNDMKLLLDKLQQVLGEPDPADEVVARNTAALEAYLGLTALDLRTVRLALHGLLGLRFATPHGTTYAAAGASGLYYTQGVIALNLFKIRKRTMQGRSTELEAVLRIFSADVVSGANRLESWMFLAQTYAYMVEDDVIWTSDKLNTPDKKCATAVLQRKSLLCYLMAVDAYTRLDAAERRANRDIAAILWTSFARELYNATFRPMDGLAFSVLPVPAFRRREGGKALASTTHTDVTAARVLRIVETALQTAIRNSATDWAAFYYLSKVQTKLRRPAETCLETLVEACRLAKRAGSSADPVIEPQCRLPWLAFKFVLRGELNVAQAGEWLAKDALTAPPDGTTPPTFRALARAVVAALRQVKAADKKNWHHKPHHRIAQIQLAVFGDTAAARTEMNTIVNLKTTVRTLVTIWKPEHERPGKHFVYVYDYILYYAEILFKQKDLDSLFTFTKKLRRLGSSMVSQPQAWDQVVPKVCDLVKWLLKVPPNFVENHIADLPFKDFMAVSLYIVQRVKTDPTVPEGTELFYYLFSEMHEFRKMTNGFSPTGLVDDTYYTIFFFLFVRYKAEYDREPEHPEVPAAQLNKQRVARRDIVPIGGDIVSHMAKKMDRVRAKVVEEELQEVIRAREEEDRVMGVKFSLVDEENPESAEFLMRKMAQAEVGDDVKEEKVEEPQVGDGSKVGEEAKVGEEGDQTHSEPGELQATDVNGTEKEPGSSVQEPENVPDAPQAIEQTPVPEEIPQGPANAAQTPQQMDVEPDTATPNVLLTPAQLSDDSAEFHTPMAFDGEEAARRGIILKEEPIDETAAAEAPEVKIEAPETAKEDSQPEPDAPASGQDATAAADAEKDESSAPEPKRLKLSRPSRSSRSRGNVEFIELD